MTASNRFHRAEPRTPRRVVASFDSYEEAERAVDLLSDRKFPVEHTAIVARDLDYVEQVTGRMTYWRAMGLGALNGAVIGVLIGWLFGLFDWFDPIVSAFWLALDGLWFGALIGAVMGLIAHALTGGRRDFAAVGGFRAKHYDVLADETFADEAEVMLADLRSSTTTPATDADHKSASDLA
jgi:uncharacterized membrane protein